MKLEEMSLTLGKFSLVFPNYSLSPEIIRLWYELFSKESLEHFYAAMLAVIKEDGRAFFPTPGEISAALRVLKEGYIPAAAEVWEDLLKIGSTGKNNDLENYLNGNSVARSALYQIGGINTLRYADIEKELPWRKKDFIKAYDECAQRNLVAKRVEISHTEALRVISQIPSSSSIGKIKTNFNSIDFKS